MLSKGCVAWHRLKQALIRKQCEGQGDGWKGLALLSSTMHYLILSVFKETFRTLREHVWSKWSFRGNFNISKQSSWILSSWEEMRVVSLIKLQSKGNSLCAQGKITMLWPMIINLIWKLIVKGKKLLTQSWFAV